ncbi:SLAC1 anion channel family protein [Campylobacter curvus]|uniref:SLAC1 anion channel family protein n=1 Tax=Campylobacter curvus TaxID=200 RepID=UPI00146FEE39|nr:SLAC1 anion channel family protein [Campylobacter curvus]
MYEDQNDILKNTNLSKLANFPIVFFAVTMGLSGLALAYERLNLLFDISQILGELLKWLTAALFIVITVFYCLKFIRYPNAVRVEFAHPVRINFFAAFSISLLLLAALFQESKIYGFLLYGGLAVQTFLTLYVVAFWIQKELLLTQSNHAWFIPIVGNLIVPLAAPTTSVFAWYYFSVGAFFWLVLFTIIFYRLIFHERLAQKFIPTLFILIAPPSLAFSGLIKLTGEFSLVAQILLNLTLFFTLLILFMFKNFLKLKFFLSWWAFTFPTAAASIAFFRAFEMTGEKFWLACAIAMFAALVFFVCFVGFYTIKAIFRREICVMEK